LHSAIHTQPNARQRSRDCTTEVEPLTAERPDIAVKAGINFRELAFATTRALCSIG
jgi:hypothetical protein